MAHAIVIAGVGLVGFIWVTSTATRSKYTLGRSEEAWSMPTINFYGKASLVSPIDSKY